VRVGVLGIIEKTCEGEGEDESEGGGGQNNREKKLVRVVECFL
jgi:hypothetical protein